MRLTCLSLAALWLSGCVSTGPEVVTIPADRYDEAFDVAIAVARDEGLPADFRDRRSGVILTDAVHAATLLEPWYHRGENLPQLWGQTLSNSRRRARFEFRPAGFDPAAAAPPPEPDILATGEPPIDLTRTEGDLELRVWVYLDRQYVVGTRKSTWSRRVTSQAEIIPAAGESTTPASFWTTSTRDVQFERRLLDRVQTALQRGEPARDSGT